MFIIARIRNFFTPLEWTIFTLIVFLMLIAACSFYDAVVLCGTEGVGPAATSNC